MKWIFLFIFLSLSAAVLHCYFTERKHQIPEYGGRWLIRAVSLPVPFLQSVLGRIPFPEEEKRKTEESLRFIAPGGNARQDAERYRLNKWTVCFWFLWIGLALLTSAVFFLNTEPVQEELLFIENAEEAQQIDAEAWIEGMEEPEKISLEIARREPTEEEKIKALGEADAYIESYFAGLGILHDYPSFPAEKGEAAFFYYSLDPSAAGDSGRPIDSWPQERTEVPFRVVVWVEDLKSSVDVSVCYEAVSKLSASEQWRLVKAEIAEGKYEDESGLTLPETTGGGLRIRWLKSGKAFSLSLGVILLGLAIIAFRVGADRFVAMKSRQEKEKAQTAIPEIVGELLIYINAGQSILNAWMNVDGAYQKRKRAEKNYLRCEMHACVLKLQNGFDFPDCLNEFSEKVDLPQIRTLCSILMQSRRMGTDRTVSDLAAMHRQLWDDYGKNKRITSEKADEKLLIPLLLMLIVVFVIVLAPAFMNLRMM